MNISVSNLTYQSSENCQLTGYKWTSDEKAIGLIVLVHGMAEHIERYEEFANFLVTKGYIVYGYNQRGHKGSILSYDDYGYMSDEDNFSAMLHDIDLVVDDAKKTYPDLPVYLFGHSMGSFLSTRYIELHSVKLNGAIICGTGLSPLPVLKLGRFFAKGIMKSNGRRYRSEFINNLAFGSYNKKFEKRTDCDWLNRNQEEIDKYVADKYCGGIFTVSFFHDFFNCMIDIQKNFDIIPREFPILLISGTMDPVGGYGKQVTKLYKKLRSKGFSDVIEILYKDARHEILKELDKKQTLEDVNFWLEKHNK